MINYRAINGKPVKSHVIGCHAHCFLGRDDNGCRKFCLSLGIYNLKCNQKYKIIYTCSQTLTAISESVS